MTIEKTFEWLFKRFQNQSIKTCAFDLECLKFLAEWVNREKETQLNNQILFAKLYCHVFIQEVNFYKDFDFAQKSMGKMLELPLQNHYELFNQRLNDYALNRFLLSNGIDPEKRKFDSEGYSDATFDKEALSKIDNDEFIKFAKGYWDYDKTQKSLNNQITESVNRFKNLP